MTPPAASRTFLLCGDEYGSIGASVGDSAVLFANDSTFIVVVVVVCVAFNKGGILVVEEMLEVSVVMADVIMGMKDTNVKENSSSFAGMYSGATHRQFLYLYILYTQDIIMNRDFVGELSHPITPQ